MNVYNTYQRSKAVTEEQLAQIKKWSQGLFDIVGTGEIVKLWYVKLDGTKSSSVGYLTEVIGQNAATSVRIETQDKGMRVINIARITRWARRGEMHQPESEDMTAYAAMVEAEWGNE